MEKQRKDYHTRKRNNGKVIIFKKFILNFSWAFLTLDLQPGAILGCGISDLGQPVSPMYKKDLAHYSSPTTLFDFYMEGRNYIVSKVSSRLWAKIIFQGLS